MRRVWTLATFSAVALSMSAGRVGAAHVVPLASRETMVGAVTALSIVPASGRAEVVISVSGPVTVQDFTVDSPHRIVVDLAGARLARLDRSYDRHPRAGITNIRLAQYRLDVVRVVLDLESPRAYSVSRSGNDVRIAVTGGETFVAWHSQSEGPAVTAIELPDVDRPVLAANVATGSVELEPKRPTTTSKPAAPSLDSLVDAASRIDSDTIDTVAPPAPIVDSVPRLPIAIFSSQSQQPRITVTWQDADIRLVIAGFAAQTGRTIVVGKNVTGTVTAEIKDQPWDVALKHILEAQGLAATEDPSGIIVVDSYQNILERQANEPLTTQLVKLNYATAASLVPTVEGLLSKDCPATPPPATGNQAPGQAWCLIRGSIRADSGTNALLITEVASRLPDLLRYVQQLDVRTPQVALKAKIISVNRTNIEQLGVSYDLGSTAAYFNNLVPRNKPGQENSVDDREGRITLGGDALAGVGNATRKYKNGSALNILFSTALGKYSLTSFIDALKESDLSDVQAEPSVVTLDNREARILVGQETPVRVIDAGSAAQIGAPVRANVQYKETGIILTVTPHITNNRQIRMTISAEQSSLNIVGGDLGFIIDKRNANTQLLVADGETAVIGGLTQTSTVKNKSGIPLLSELPLIGRLFSQSDSREIKQDLLILITPHIIDEGQAVRPPGNDSK